jgi:hypothetical protein
MQRLFQYTLGTLFLLPLALNATPVDEVFISANFDTLEPGYVAAVTSTGAVINPTLIPNLVEPGLLAAFGNNLLVAGLPFAAIDSIAEFTTAGALVNPNFIPETNFPAGITVSGSDLFILNDNGTISEYTTSGALVNASLVSGLSTTAPGFPAGIAVSGSNLFVTNSGQISEYTTSGALVNPALLSSLIPSPIGIVAIGSDLFILSQGGAVSEFTTSGTLVGILIPAGGTSSEIATDGSNLFLAGSLGVGEYTTSGAFVASIAGVPLVFGTPGLDGIAIAPIPEPSTLLLVPAGLAVAAIRIARRRRDLKRLKP